MVVSSYFPHSHRSMLIRPLTAISDYQDMYVSCFAQVHICPLTTMSTRTTIGLFIHPPPLGGAVGKFPEYETLMIFLILSGAFGGYKFSQKKLSISLLLELE